MNIWFRSCEFIVGERFKFPFPKKVETDNQLKSKESENRNKVSFLSNGYFWKVFLILSKDLKD